MIFDGKRIFITGGTGFFGKSLLDLLFKRGIRAEVWILSRDPEGFLRRNPEFASAPFPLVWRCGDVRDFAFPPVAFDCVIHAASCPANAPEVEDFTQLATRRAIALAERDRARIVFLSSGAVYGPLAAPVSESAIPRPVTGYGRAKFAAERLFSASGLRAVIARCFCFIGPRIPTGAGYAAADFLFAAAGRRNPVITGSADSVRSYLAADAWAERVLALAAGELEGTFNLGSPHHVTVGNLAAKIAALRGLAAEDRSAGEASFYVPDTRKLDSALALPEPEPLEKTLESTLKTIEDKRKKS